MGGRVLEVENWKCEQANSGIREHLAKVGNYVSDCRPSIWIDGCALSRKGPCYIIQPGVSYSTEWS